MLMECDVASLTVGGGTEGNMACAFHPRFKAGLVPQLQKAVRDEILQVEVARAAVALVPACRAEKAAVHCSTVGCERSW